jgi:hypothetical protein
MLPAAGRMGRTLKVEEGCQRMLYAAGKLINVEEGGRRLMPSAGSWYRRLKVEEDSIGWQCKWLDDRGGR